MLWDGLGQGWSSFSIWRPIFSCCPHPTPTWWLQLSPQKRERDTKTHWTKLLHTHDNTPTYAHIKEQFICAQFKALLHADINLLHHAVSLKPDWSLIQSRIKMSEYCKDVTHISCFSSGTWLANGTQLHWREGHSSWTQPNPKWLINNTERHTQTHCVAWEA